MKFEKKDGILKILLNKLRFFILERNICFIQKKKSHRLKFTKFLGLFDFKLLFNILKETLN